MRKFEKFLFYYGIIAVTVFFVAYGIYSPKPVNFINGLLMLPIVFYFWLKFSQVEEISPAKWSLRAIIIIVLFTMIGIGSYFLMTNIQTTREEKINKTATPVVSEVASVSASPTSSNTPKPKGTSISEILNPEPKIKVKGSFSVSVYASPSQTSQKVGEMEPEVEYLFDTKEENWYRVNIDSETIGWVMESNVQEINN